MKRAPQQTGVSGTPTPRDISPQQLAAILESLDDAIISKTLDGTITSWNAGAERMYGYLHDEVIGHDISLIVPADRRAELQQIYERIGRGERIHGLETVRITRDGRRRDISLSITPLLDPAGTIVGATAISRDITEQKEIERQLLYQANLLQNVSDAIIATDLDYTIRSWNRAAESTYGWHEEEVLGRVVTDVLGTDFLNTSRTKVLSSFNRHGFWRGEVVQYCKDGRAIDVSASTSMVRDRSGKPVGIVAVNRDVTAEKRTERQIAYQAMLLQNVSDAVIGLSLDYRILSWNHAAELLYGWREEEVLGQDLSELLKTRFLNTSRRQVREEIVRNGMATAELIHYRRDGRELNIMTSASPLLDSSGTTIGFVSINRDITRARQLQREVLEVSEYEQRRIGRDLHDGLGSHLSGLAMLARGLAADLREGRSLSAAEMEEIAELSSQGAEQARSLSRGLNPLGIGTGGLADALREVAARTERHSGISCVFQLRSDIPELAEGVASHLFWIVKEAVNNAVKHSRARNITIDAECYNGRLLLSVTDDGIGLSQEHIENEGLGLHTMQYRADIIGAEFTISQRGAGGTIVRCSVRFDSTETPTRRDGRTEAIR
jgi:PAS domain S-box-containing protein